MKKILIAATFALAAASASALEVGVTAARDYASDDRNAVGLTVGQKYGKFGVTAGFDRATRGDNDQNRYSLVGSYDVATLGPVTIAGKAGVAYLDNQVGQDGYAALVGVGASMPITKTIAATADFTRQYGQDRVSQYNGNRITVGLKYSF